MTAATDTDAAKRSHPKIDAAIERAVAMGEEGLKVAVWVGDELLIDTWTGVACRESRKKVDCHTLFPVFSVGKALVATAVHIQAERGLVDYAAPLAKYWPEFGNRGKERITVRQVLTHRAGLPQMPEDVTPERMIDWNWMIAELEKMEPLWEPGSQPSYLALTFGWLLGELVCRTDLKKRAFGDFVQDEICRPLGIDSFFIGVPASERDRVATLYAESFVRVGAAAAPYNHLALPKAVVPGPLVYNRADVQAGCIPGANAVGDARSVARMFSLLAGHGKANGIRLLSEDRVMSFTQLREDPYADDLVIGRPPMVGMGGYFVGGEYPPAEPVIGASPHTLCQPGGGQSIAWADLDEGFSAAIAHNRMFGNFPPRKPEDHPFWAIGDAIREVVAEHKAIGDGGELI